MSVAVGVSVAVAVGVAVVVDVAVAVGVAVVVTVAVVVSVGVAVLAKGSPRPIPESPQTARYTIDNIRHTPTTRITTR